jgi:hypothetical protein
VTKRNDGELLKELIVLNNVVSRKSSFCYPVKLIIISHSLLGERLQLSLVTIE